MKFSTLPPKIIGIAVLKHEYSSIVTIITPRCMRMREGVKTQIVVRIHAVFLTS